ncbi:b(0,+)-type amino acid transporter 1-like isoform X1 [Varroa jacobsoni]|uniref:b(0,+)-type amino acid transporter 1-like isoform X1 n=1 Tax=Varroa jacobsoni TaxID=62625 RepID=UPI000BF79E30|nr:b(0,+)-type amino acid transporter 1-like isoform X1 [Varroa jacobsoni]XP_022711527.1 b(0,+)-type amino acid transporter 1-like isoform X1 [Varroa jacobsoni]
MGDDNYEYSRVHKLTEAQKSEHNGVRMAADYSNNRRYSATDSKPGKNHQDNDESTRLERTLGLMSGVTLIIGTMIGSGIFVSPKGVFERTGSVGLTLVVWAGCGLLSLFGSLSFAELGTIINKSGGDYIYIYECFRGYCGGSIPAFIHAWTFVLLLKPASLGIMALSFAKYLVAPFFLTCSDIPQEPMKLIALACIALVTYINCASVSVASRIQTVFTIAKLSAIVAIILGGCYWIAMGRIEHLAKGFEGSTTSFSDIATAFYSGLWAYDGWNNLNYVTEELINPYVNLPRAIWIAIPMVTLCYVLINVAYLTVLSSVEFLASEAVAVRFGNQVFGSAAAFIALCVAASTFGSSNGSTFTASRISFSAAREGHQLALLSYIHKDRLTPCPALIVNGVLGAILILISDIASLIDLFGFAAWLFYGLATFTLIVFRFTRPDDHRPYKVNIAIPIITCIVASYLVVAPIVRNPQIEYLYACAFMASGLIFYVPFVHFRLRLSINRYITTLVQCVLHVIPTTQSDEEIR